MRERNSDNHSSILRLSLIPGLGHLVLGERRRGVHLLAFSVICILILASTWERFLEAFRGSAIDHWIASLFLVACLLSLSTFSVRDVRRLVTLGEGRVQPKSPLRIALRRFQANRLAVWSLYVIGALYFVAILTPLLTPYDPAAIENVLETRYLV